MFKVFITFDLDCAVYTEKWDVIDEFFIVENLLLPFLKENNIKTTWFIRIDKKIENDFGKPDYFFNKYSRIINRLLYEGHSFGWHPHVYSFKDKRWGQNTDELEIISELSMLLPYTKRYKLNIVRLGWGFVTNKIMKFLNDEGFVIDSSAIPRPNYMWEETKKDWTITKNKIYYPSKTDYRIASERPDDNLNILEIPITTMKIKAPYDTEKDVIRYCNPAYYHEAFKEPLPAWIKDNDCLVTISHPYEIDDSLGLQNSLLSFSLSEFIKNISYIKSYAEKYSKRITFKTLPEQLSDNS